MTVGDLQTAGTGVCVLSAQVSDVFTTNLVHMYADLHALPVTIIGLHICRSIIVTGSACRSAYRLRPITSHTRAFQGTHYWTPQIKDGGYHPS